MLTIRDAINDFLMHWLFCADVSAGDREPLVTLIWLIIIALLAIASLIAACAWPINGDAIRSRRCLNDEAKRLPPLPAGSLKRGRSR